MLSQRDREVIHDVALRHFVKDYVVEDVILCIEHELFRIMNEANAKNGDFPTINIMNMGKFVVSVKKREFARRKYGPRDQDIDERETDISEGASVTEAPDSLESL